MQSVELGDVLAYRHDPLVRAYMKKTGLPIDEVEELFVDLKKWLWLVGQRKDPEPHMPSFVEQGAIDGFWHEFILHTKDYSQFCELYFGRYVHHTPTPDGMNDAGREMAITRPEEYECHMRDLFSYAMREVYLKLGEETMVRWYKIIPAKYPQLR